MLFALFQKMKNESGLGSFFYHLEIFFLSLIFLCAWFLRPKRPQSQFKVREADLIQAIPTARPQKISLVGKPHEILGIPLHSTVEEIQQAYRDLMKQYHPDCVGAQGSREWKEAQVIADAIIQAKVAMISQVRKKE